MELLMSTPYLSAGEKFNRLTALKDCPRAKHMVLVRCDCGVEKEVNARNVKAGRVKSCGCLLREHNERQSASDPFSTERRYTYRSWEAMLARCTNRDHPHYDRYGGRGISICPEWNSFDNFLSDMGYRPSGLVLDRVDNDQGYFKDNCRWTTQKANTRNRSEFNRVLTALGESKTVAEWAEDARCRTNIANLYKRIEAGWEHGRAIFTPTDTRFRPQPVDEDS